MAWIDHQEVKALVDKEDGMAPVYMGGNVYDPLQFVEDGQDPVVQLTPRQYRFLSHYRQGVALKDACEKAGWTLEQAERFFASDKARRWLSDKAKKDLIKQKWGDPAEVYAEADRLYHDDEAPKHRVDLLKEFWDRAVPKISRNTEPVAPKIEIHISNPDAIVQAFDRQKAIETQIEKELGQ